jgi:hypothetical protein
MRLIFAACATLFLAFAPPIALAQEGAPVVATTELPAASEVLVTEDTSVTLPAGEELKAITDALTNVLMPTILAIIAGLLAMAPGYVKVIVGLFLTEKNIRLAIQRAINAIPGAASGVPLQVDVGNRVVAVAAQYFIDSVPDWLVKWLGGPNAIPDKVLSRISLAPDAGKLVGKQPIGMPITDPRHVTNRT